MFFAFEQSARPALLVPTRIAFVRNSLIRVRACDPWFLPIPRIIMMVFVVIFVRCPRPVVEYLPSTADCLPLTFAVAKNTLLPSFTHH